MPGPVSLPHVRALDGVRGAAIAGVLIFHGGKLTGGYLGVDLFFVLSGFLITSLLLTESRATGEVNLSAFWARRARRLLPALFLVLLGVAAYAAFVADPAELERIRGDALATLGYVANWRFVLRGFDYWALFSAPSPLAHTWSISIEEQFYLLWPLAVTGLLWAARRRGADARAAITRSVLVVCVVGAVASAGLMALVHGATGDAGRVYYGTDTRAQSILVGAALGAVVTLRGPVRGVRGRRVLEGAAIVGAAVLALAWARLDGTSATLYRGGLLVSALAGAAVIAAGAHPEPGPVARVLSLRPLVALGIISYGVYLWHWPIYVWLNEERVGLAGWALLGVRVAVTLVFATASFLLVERPLRYAGLSAQTLRWLTPAAAMTLVAVTILSTAAAAPPLAAGERESAADAAAAARRTPGSIRLMIVGSSVAAFLAKEGFEQVRTETPLAVLDAAQVACVFPTTPKVRIPSEPAGVVLPDCRTGWADAVAQFRPAVVLAAYNDVGTFAFRRHGSWVEPCSDEFARWYPEALDDAVATLGAGGARVVLTTSAYQLSEYDRPEVRRQAECANALTREYVRGHPAVELIDLAAFVCPELDRCRLRADGVVLRPDGVHYRGEGARFVAGWLLEQLDLPSRAAGSGAGRAAP